MLSINRYFVKQGRGKDFQDLFATRTRRLENYIGEHLNNFTGGWRLDPEGSEGEFVFFSAWDDAKKLDEALDEDRGYYEFTSAKTIVIGVEMKNAVFEFETFK